MVRSTFMERGRKVLAKRVTEEGKTFQWLAVVCESGARVGITVVYRWEAKSSPQRALRASEETEVGGQNAATE
jgi:hypothetical protein